MIALTAVLIVWGIGTAVTFLFGFVTYVDARGPVPRRKGARMMFGAPAWFFVCVIIAARNFRQAWRDADWEGMKR